MKWLVTLVGIAALMWTLASPQSAASSPYARYGIQDDAWLTYGPGTVADRVATLDRMGVTLVRFTLNWHEIAAQRPARARPDRPRLPLGHP